MRFHPRYCHRHKVQEELTEQTALLETHAAELNIMAAEGWSGQFKTEFTAINTAIGDRKTQAL